MLNYLWPILVIASFSYGIISGRAEEVNKSIFNSASNAVEICITLLRHDVPLEWYNANCDENKSYEKNDCFFKTIATFFISRHKRN